MKILSNKKYNELILKSCRGMFGAVTDDMLLKNCGAMQQEVDNYKSILTELEEWLKNYIPLLEAGDMLEEATQDTLKEVLDKIQELKERYK